MAQLLWKIVWWFLKKLKMELLCDQAISLLGIFPREMKTYDLYIKTYTQMFITSLFIIKKMETTQMSVQWTDKMWHIHIV